ncbi:hypothetical protein [Nonomuraea helvata]|uniref:Uncharacterized protein n=1 Tax=Nonomuraea helvata TaxID=37484 RepID=A0ABV5SCK1_9ACTN
MPVLRGSGPGPASPVRDALYKAMLRAGPAGTTQRASAPNLR